MNRPPIYGLAAEFASPAELVEAAKAVRAAGYTRIDAYTPLPVEGLSGAIGAGKSRLPLLVLIGGIVGAIGGYLMQYVTAVHWYPFNIGGRPLNSWPAFIPVVFECTVLGASLTAVIGMLALCGLPAPYHPLFHLQRFSRVSRDLSFLCVESRDPLFEVTRTRELLTSLGAASVEEVPQ